MKLFEDYIQRHFREATSTEEVDVDDLWADIEAGLPPEKEEEAVAGSPFRGLVLSLLLGGLVLAGLLFWPWGEQPERVLTGAAAEKPIIEGIESGLPTGQTDLNSKNSQAVTVDTEKEQVNASPLSSTSSASLEKRHSAPAGPAKKSASVSNETKVESNSPSGATTGRAKVQRENAAAGTTETPSRTTETSTTKTALTQASNLTTSQDKFSPDGERVASPISNSTAFALTKEAGVSSALLALAQLPALAIEPLSIDEKPLALPTVSPYVPAAETFRKASTAKLEFRASAGSSLMLRKYLNPSEGNAANALNAAVGNTFGQSVSLEFSYRLSNKLRLNSGLEYWRTHNTFRYTIERDSFTVHPSFPERTTAAKYIRRITHNNYQQFLALPILLEYRQVFGRFEAGLGAGLALNYQLQANGRTLASRDEVVSYDSSSGDTPDFFLSYRLRPSLMFSPKPNSRTKFLLQTDVQYYRFGESSVTGLSQRAILLGGSIGISYRL